MSKPQFVYVTYVETTPEKLWEALTSSEFTRQYWFGAEVKSDWKVGSPFALMLDGSITDSGEILEADPPRRLSYSSSIRSMRSFAMNRYRGWSSPSSPSVRS
jgi:uncharacterized protein YndB with AHSA1/START domain